MKSVKPALLATLDKNAQHLQIAIPFVEKFGEKLPASTGHLMIGIWEKPTLEVSLRYVEGAARERALSIMGDVFGREGWRGKLNSSGNEYDWRKEIDGVVVKIEGAEAIPFTVNEFPIQPSKFPLQLADSPA